MSEVSDRKQPGGASAADAVGIEEAVEAEAESQGEDLGAEGDSAGTEEGQASEELDEEVGEEGVWRVYRAKDFTTTLLDYEPGAEGSHPTGIDLRRAAIRTGGEPEGVYSLDKLDRILQNVRRTGRSLKAYPICEARDADHSVDISEDKLKATLHIRKGRGLGKALVLKEVGAAIRESGVKGLDNERIKTDVLEFFRSARHGLSDYELATGTAPGTGEARTITWEASFLNDQQVGTIKARAENGPPDDATAEIASLGAHPIAEVEEMAFVEADEIVAVMSEPDVGESGVDVFGKVIPGNAGEDVNIKALENIKIDGCNIVAKMTGVLDRWVREDRTFVRVRPHRDSVVKVSIAEDNLTASVALVVGEGTGEGLSLEGIRKALDAAGVKKGIDDQDIGMAVAAATREGSVRDHVVARGEIVRDGDESRLTFQVNLASGNSVTIQENGQADYKNQDRITTVRTGDFIAEILPPEIKPTDGWDVRGNTIRAKVAPPLRLNIGQGIRQERMPDGKLRLYADSEGEILYDGGSLEIRRGHTVQGDVGLSTGNIKFSGAVGVTGSVTTGFYVMAAGPVVIKGGVEGSLISSEESIRIDAGVVGSGKAVLRAKQEISAAFAEHATLLAVGDISIKNACLRCNLRTNGVLKLLSEKGHLVGGKAQAKDGVNVMNLGAESGAKTQISFGQDYLVADRIELEEREMEKLKKTQTSIDFEIRQMEKDQDRKGLEKARQEKVYAIKAIEKRSERLLVLRERFERHYPSEVVVRGTAYPGVVLESHGRTHEINVETKNTVFIFNSENGHIEEKITGAKEPASTD